MLVIRGDSHSIQLHTNTDTAKTLYEYKQFGPFASSRNDKDEKISSVAIQFRLQQFEWNG